MKTKLTLTIDQKIIERARVRSKKEGRSISQMFEDTFSPYGQLQPAALHSAKQAAAAEYIEMMKTQLPARAISDREERRQRAAYLAKKHG
jgi:hypothetical protein